jgi:hypothetical protein
VRFLLLALVLALAACASAAPSAPESEFGPHPAFHPPEVGDE